MHHQPLISPLPMKQVTEKHPFLPNLPTLTETMATTYEMYSNNWIVFQPDIIIDAIQGCMWKTEINLSAFPDMISDR